MSRGQFIPSVLIWGGGGGEGGNKSLGKGPLTPADHTGRLGSFLGLFFVHGKSLRNAMFFLRLKQRSTGKYMKEAVTSLFPGSPRAEH